MSEVITPFIYRRRFGNLGSILLQLSWSMTRHACYCGFAALCGLKNLRFLDLSYNNLDDEGLPWCLAGELSFLEQLIISYNCRSISLSLLTGNKKILFCISYTCIMNSSYFDPMQVTRTSTKNDIHTLLFGCPFSVMWIKESSGVGSKWQHSKQWQYTHLPTTWEIFIGNSQVNRLYSRWITWCSHRYEDKGDILHQ